MHGSGRAARAAAVLLAGAALLGACSSTTGTARRTAHIPARLVTTSTTAVPTTTSAAAVSSTTTTAPVPAAAPATTTVTDVAGQRIVVDAGGYGATTATLTAYQRTSAGWRAAFGPFTAYLGYNGLAPPGAKREGDGRTPSGTYGFSFAFGVDADPGVKLAWRAVTGPNIVWDDDPSSPLYNQWVDTSSANAGANPEPMDNQPAYDDGAVIAYNTAPVVPGAGSAIFLHVATGGPTAGCVSLPMTALLEVLRWLDPAQGPTITMAVGAGPP
jgi:L,D-peptidoglycan transpeptidase YkuD (ErfK/YbiS/YcfS/YnhG family)